VAMPRLTYSVPKIGKKTVSGTCYAIVRIGGRVHYCGRWGTKASRVEYDRLIGEWIQSGRPSRAVPVGETTITEMCAAFWKAHKPKFTSTTATHFKLTTKSLREKYGHVPVDEFGGRSLKTSRASFVAQGQSRKYVNQRVQRV